MKNKKKMGLAAVLFIAIVVGLGIFVYHRQADVEVEQWCPCPHMGSVSYSNNGLFFYGEKGITYKDAKNGKQMTICAKAGCSHQDKNCPAFVEDATVEGIILYDNKLNFLDDEGTERRGLNLLQSDIDGENRKKLAYFSDIQRADAVCYTENNVVVGYTNSMDLKKREQVDYREAGIYLYDRKTKKGKKLLHEKSMQNTILFVNVVDGMIYYSRTYYPLSDEDIENQTKDLSTVQPELRLYRISVEGGKPELIDNQLNTTMAGVTKVGNEVIYSAVDGLKAYSAETGKTRMLVEGKGISLITNYLSDEQAIYAQSVNQDNRITYYSYKAGDKIEKIGESDNLLIIIFDDVTYGMGETGTGSSVLSIFETRKWMGGEFQVKYESNGEE